MKNITPYITMASIAAALYLSAAYTRPHEPAGRALRSLLDTCTVELPRLPFSGLLRFENEYSPRPTLRPLQVVPPSATPYTPRELSEIYPTH